MTGYAGFLLAFGAAAGVHLAALGLLPAAPGGEAAGGGGEEQLSVSIAGDDLSDLVARWDSQPSVTDAPTSPTSPRVTKPAQPTPFTDNTVQTASLQPLLPVERPDAPTVSLPSVSAANLTPPTLDAAPLQPRTTNAPALEKVAALVTPSAVLPPALDTKAPDVPDYAVLTSLRPTPRSARPVETRARGTGSSATAGAGKADAPQAGPSRKTIAAAEAAWASAIQRKIARAQVYPRGGRGDGRVRLAMTITSNGQLAGVQVVTSSGVAAFDKAAVRAAKRAAPFPAAPDVLTKDRFAFGQWVAFQR